MCVYACAFYSKRLPYRFSKVLVLVIPLHVPPLLFLAPPHVILTVPLLPFFFLFRSLHSSPHQ